MTKKRRNILIQVLACTLFMLQPVLLPSRPPLEGSNLFSSVILKDYLANALIILFFYTNYFYLIPRLYFRKKYTVYSFAIIAGLFLIAVFPSIIISKHIFQGQHLSPFPPPPPGFGINNSNDSLFSKFQYFFSDIDQNVYLFIVIIFFSLSLKIRSRWFATEQARHDAEISFLMSQINPHFLFNALNSIYTLAVKEKAQSSSESILKLSGMMRYIITETQKDFVPLQKEIDYINDYIELQKLRLDKSIKLNYKCRGIFSNQKIAPLLLIPFIENAFKHGVNPDEDSEININLNAEQDFLNLKVENNKVTSETAIHEKTGLGVGNTKNRLSLLYPSKHNLIITDSLNFYSVNLIVFF